MTEILDTKVVARQLLELQLTAVPTTRAKIFVTDPLLININGFQFQFVNSFLALFYTAFYLQDMDKLKEV